MPIELVETAFTKALSSSSPPTPPPLDDLEQGSILKNTNDNFKDEKQQNEDKVQSKPEMWTKIWQGTAIVCIIVNLINMVITVGVTILSGLFAFVVAGGVFYFQFQIQDLDSLRTIQNNLRNKVNEFATVNLSLSNNVTNLSTKCDTLQDMELQLRTLAEDSGITSNKLVKLVQENQRILHEERQLIQSDVVQAMIEVIFQADGDESSHLSDKEVQKLIVRMKNLPAITVNEGLLRRKLMLADGGGGGGHGVDGKHRSVRTIIGLVLQELDDMNNDDDDNNDTVNKTDRVFQIHHDKHEAVTSHKTGK